MRTQFLVMSLDPNVFVCDFRYAIRPQIPHCDMSVHVNSNTTRCKERGLLMIWNQTPEPQSTQLRVSLYYTGLTDVALVSAEGATPVQYTLARDYTIELQVEMDPMSLTWYTITE